ncbi:hypothetical protein GUITHDRAFT_139655 [Guillardia theta CCMP2712]|uniref:Uncharacterized protein n=1 Tax=Guillardia theta (strain CCMP2712) TaxID=905079 RepID=L1J871_GUITC|nr:hypothetical protein GUITHDRAFT_139655 [Guillardia theta CCMP2712]EKX44736.1 hypothetical protein GUITHDRAFT_139655 [Guillardia theta CCMP2712]|eukprot:XP_005831716.1 hypothetical protein GUITHDRAFT_139655 [Guillardia theta CCMP2712]
MSPLCSRKASAAGKLSAWSISWLDSIDLKQAHGYEYHDISLSDYPEKRTDMLSLADRLTVPQIFVNTVHIGGASELIELLEKGKFEKIVKPAELEEELLCAGSECLKYEDVVVELRNGLRISDRTYHGFVLIFSITLQHLMISKVGNSFLDSNVFHHVCRDHPLKDEGLYYRLQFSALQSKYTNSEGLIDYAAISKDSEFWAFFINLYNLMVLHAFAQVGIPQTSFRRMSFFDTVGVVAMAFLEMEENLKVDKDSKTVYLTKILSWYRTDFGSSDKEVLRYDWNTNASNFVAYNPQELKDKVSECTIA